MLVHPLEVPFQIFLSFLVSLFCRWICVELVRKSEVRVGLRVPDRPTCLENSNRNLSWARRLLRQQMALQVEGFLASAAALPPDLFLL